MLRKLPTKLTDTSSSSEEGADGDDLTADDNQQRQSDPGGLLSKKTTSKKVVKKGLNVKNVNYQSPLNIQKQAKIGESSSMQSGNIENEADFTWCSFLYDKMQHMDSKSKMDFKMYVDYLSMKAVHHKFNIEEYPM